MNAKQLDQRDDNNGSSTADEAATDVRKKLPLAELLARSMEADALDFEPPTLNDRERWDEDEGSSGG